MINIEKTKPFMRCNSCYKQGTVYNIVIRYDGTNQGTQIRLCDDCLQEIMRKTLKINTEGEGMKPTEKQIEYAAYLAKRVCKNLPDEFTKEAYSKFIDKWKPVVKYEDKAMNEPDSWQMQYM